MLNQLLLVLMWILITAYVGTNCRTLIGALSNEKHVSNSGWYVVTNDHVEDYGGTLLMSHPNGMFLYKVSKEYLLYGPFNEVLSYFGFVNQGMIQNATKSDDDQVTTILMTPGNPEGATSTHNNSQINASATVLSDLASLYSDINAPDNEGNGSTENVRQIRGSIWQIPKFAQNLRIFPRHKRSHVDVNFIRAGTNPESYQDYETEEDEDDRRKREIGFPTDYASFDMNDYLTK